MKQKRKYHEISEDENNSSIKTLVDSNANKRIKISQIAALPNFDPEEDEVWIVRLPNHLNPDELHNKEVFSFKNYLFHLYLNVHIRISCIQMRGYVSRQNRRLVYHSF